MTSNAFDLSNIEKVMLSTAIISGIIHIYAGLSFSFDILILAGIGFLAGSVLFIRKSIRNYIVLASIPYTGSQFYFYYQYYGFEIGALAGIDKALQAILLIASLIYLKDNFSRR